MATNHIFNMPPEEKAAFYGRRPSPFSRMIDASEYAGPLDRYLNDPPTNAAFAWTNVAGHSYIGPVRDQGNCGSCYAFGAAAAAEGTYNKAMGRTDASCVDFSESFIIWCLATLPAYSSHFSGCEGADYDYYELQALTVEGITYEANFPYVENNPGSCTHWGDPRVSFSSWHRVPCNDIDAIKTAIMNYGVVDAAVKVTSAFEGYSGGIYNDANTGCSGSPCAYTTTDHAISLVGWNDNGDPANGYWILRNSWGSSWGESGYMRISYRAAAVACAVCYLVYTNAPGVAPTASTEPASSITTNAATLAGIVNPQGSDSYAFFEYGTTTAYGNNTAPSSVGSGSSGTSVSRTVNGLAPNTTYHFRCVATNAYGRSNGSDLTFHTAAVPASPPAVITDPATDVSDVDGVLRGRVNPNGQASAYRFEYGATTNYGQTTAFSSAGSGTAYTSVQATISGLANNTLYHFSIVATNASGSARGVDRTFTTTSGPQAPSVVTLAAAPVASDAATLNGTVNPNSAATTYWFEYGQTTGYGSATPYTSAGSGSSAVTVNAPATGLSPETTYHFRLCASNAYGATTGADMSFTTPALGDSILTEDFEHGGALPAGWTQEYVDRTRNWEAVNGSPENHPPAAYRGNYNAIFLWENGSTRLVTPPIDFTGRTNNATLTFWHYMEDWYRDQDELRIYYKPSAGAEWTLAAQYNSRVDTWTKRTISLPDPSTNYYIAFQGVAQYGYGVCIDEVRVTAEISPITQPVFESFPSPPTADGQLVIRWASEDGRAYNLYTSTNLLAGFSQILTNIPAVPPMNTYTDSIGITPRRFYRLESTAP